MMYRETMCQSINVKSICWTGRSQHTRRLKWCTAERAELDKRRQTCDMFGVQKMKKLWWVGEKKVEVRGVLCVTRCGTIIFSMLLSFQLQFAWPYSSISFEWFKWSMFSQSLHESLGTDWNFSHCIRLHSSIRFIFQCIQQVVTIQVLVNIHSIQFHTVLRERAD